MSDEQNQHDGQQQNATHHEAPSAAALAAAEAVIADAGGTATVPVLGAPGASTPAALAPIAPDAPAKRFAISKTEKSGPVSSFAGIDSITDDGVGHTDNTHVAWHCVGAGYSVIDALSGEQYDGSKPKPKPAAATTEK